MLLMNPLRKSEEGRYMIGVLGRSLAFTALLGGGLALPFLDDLLDWLEKWTGTPYRKNMEKTLKDLDGDYLAKFGANGLAGLIGADISGSIKLGLPDFSTEGAMGAISGLISKGRRSFDAITHNEYMRALESASPVALENVFKGIRLHTEGLKTSRGKQIFDEKGNPVKLTLAEAAAQAASFRPLALSENYRDYASFKNAQDKYRSIREDFYTRFRFARTFKDKLNIMREADAYNAEIRRKGLSNILPTVTFKKLQQYARQKADKKLMEFANL
ncbi:hypothetical protein MCHI_001181 [Candidatus Magnetoovum chiemensis]|nr:hypothetical protein MCHI_001181 [Candidatus Magnetoovum chiemensis]